MKKRAKLLKSRREKRANTAKTSKPKTPKTKRKEKTVAKTKPKKSVYKKRNRFFGRKRLCFDPLADECPPIVEDTITFLEEHKALDEEGIFRRSGSAALTRQLKAKYEKGKIVNLNATNGRKIDCHSVAGVLILFFRQLPNPLLTFELYECFISATDVPDPSTRMECIHQCVDLLPPGNKAVLVRLVSFLCKVVQNKDINKMDVKNLGIVFAPTMLRPPGAAEASISSLLGDSLHTHRLMEAFILRYEDIFGNNKNKRLKLTDARSSLSPNQRADFFRKLKRGTIRLAEAMIIAQNDLIDQAGSDGDKVSSSSDSDEEKEEQIKRLKDAREQLKETNGDVKSPSKKRKKKQKSDDLSEDELKELVSSVLGNCNSSFRICIFIR
eukprot:TRINITY_DN2058_c0_g1_i1.p1 TRINITY_DN2058_c0_g1~~TRINITY_DN2058_c0_g1_i1.p1  ORF type:complete len:383 (+),score=78.58 TRINITY_DN2058_c0_g1_i1:36-1184(+)